MARIVAPGGVNGQCQVAHNAPSGLARCSRWAAIHASPAAVTTVHHGCLGVDQRAQPLAALR